MRRDFCSQRYVAFCGLALLLAALVCCGEKIDFSLVDQGVEEEACGSCHALPPASGRHAQHAKGLECNACHACVVDDTRAFVDGPAHRNAVVDICGSTGSDLVFDPGARSCANSGCHAASMSWRD